VQDSANSTVTATPSPTHTRLEHRVQELETEVAELRRELALRNVEGHSDFDLNWSWAGDDAVAPGFTAVIRAKDEALSLPWVLPPLLRAVRRVLLVDNGSTDGTPEVARRVALECGAADALEVRSYPFSVARCGPEHLATTPQSVHSLTYFYNWSFSHVRTGYALKWDGDMLLTDTGIAALQDLSWQLEAVERVVTMVRYPLYVADGQTAFLDLSVVNREPWAWPNKADFTHTKAFEWELPRWPAEVETISMPDWSCLELKHLDADEFSHWSHDDFDTSSRTLRKKRERAVFRALADRQDPPLGVIRVDAPAGRHVIEYVRGEWVPQQRDELIRLHRRVLLRMAMRKD
jgi:hypothetical protein